MAGTTSKQMKAARKAGKVSDLKGSGAKYSTTNRKGVTSYYKSGKDVDSGKDPIKQTQNGVVIPANNLTPVDKVTMPQKPTPTDPGDIAGANNKAMGTGLSAMGYTVDDKGLFSYSAPTQEAQPSSFSSIFNEYMGAQEAPPNTADIYAKELRRSGVEDLQQEVGNKTAQLNAITANSQAEQLKLEGQGRGQTAGFIGGEQARINREAAIAALPVQAQLSAAQGNLEMAQQQLTTMFNLKSQDAIAKYNYKSKVLDAVFNFATAEQQRRLDAIKTKEDRDFQIENRNLGIANQWAMQALEYGQSTVAGQIMALKSNSPTYQADLARLQGQVRKPVAPTVAKAPTLQNFGTSDAPQWRQYNASTGSWDAVSGIGGGANAQTGFQDPSNLNAKYTELLRDIGDAKVLAENGAVGAGMIERGVKSLFTSNPNYAQVQNIADTIKANLLTLNTDPNIKKFFGPQMSNRDTELMTGAASTLNPDKQTPAQFQRDLQDAAQLIARARSVVSAQAPRMQNFIVAPDGTEIEIID